MTNAERKAQEYRDLAQQQSNKCANVKLINLSSSAIGIFDNCRSNLLDILSDVKYDTATKRYVIGKITAIAIRASYFIFCR